MVERGEQLKRYPEQTETTNSLSGTNKRLRNVAGVEERIERLEDKINLIENVVEHLKESLGMAFTRMDDFHQWVDMVMGRGNIPVRRHDRNDAEIIVHGPPRR